MAMNLIRAFTGHPASVGESYTEHLFRALYFGLRMVFAGLACLVHGVLPFLFVTVGSRTIRRLAHRLERRQPTLSTTAMPAAEAARSA